MSEQGADAWSVLDGDPWVIVAQGHEAVADEERQGDDASVVAKDAASRDEAVVAAEDEIIAGPAFGHGVAGDDGPVTSVRTGRALSWLRAWCGGLVTVGCGLCQGFRPS